MIVTINGNDLEKSGHSPQIEEADRFQAVVREFLHEVLADSGNC